MVRVFYRIVRTNPPTVVDFLSKVALGQVDPRSDATTHRLESGISAYRTEAQARRKARALPGLGQFIAAIRLEDGAPVECQRTTSSRGHHTLWGEPAALLARVVAVTAI